MPAEDCAVESGRVCAAQHRIRAPIPHGIQDRETVGVIDALSATVIGAALLAAVWLAVLAVRARAPRRGTLAVLAAVELLVLVQAVAAGVLLARGERPDGVATFVGYHLAALLTLPAGVAWSVTDRSRWSPVVLTVACLTVAVLTVRLQQIWATA